MKRTLISTAAILTLLASAVFAFADIALQKSAASPAEPRTVLFSSLEIVSDPKAYDARLQISENAFKRMQQGANENAAGTSLGTRLRNSSTRTMMAGVFMFLAVSFAGVWLARSGQRRNQKAVVAVLLFAVVVGAATVIVRANAGPPGYIRWQNLAQHLKDGKPTSGDVSVEIVPGDGNIKLILPIRKKNPSEE
jgi:lipopolysaccharide export LptBFGC system permease protein LptF